MPSPGSCSRCNRALPPDSDGGLCPACRRLAAATVSDDPDATRTPNAAGADLDGFSVDPALYLPEPPPGYDLIRRLGAGGMGTVYLAREHAAERVVAMKLLNAPGSPSAFERFLVEARALARLDHPNIVKVFAVETNWREPFLTMEYAPGGTLADLQRPAPAAAARLVLAAADAVAAAHAAGILHRDIKPSNILLKSAGGQEPGVRGQESGVRKPAPLTPDSCPLTPVVSDFGLAKRTDRDDGLTRTGPLGTPAYMSPEAAAGRFRDIGPPADVYGLGATLYYLLTGRPPFAGEGPEGILGQVLRDPPTRPRALRPDVPAPLEAVAVKALEKDPAARYPTPAALAADLRRFLAGEAPGAPVLSRRRRTTRWLGRNRKRIGVAVAALAVATLLVAAGREFWKPADQEKQIQAEIAAGKEARLLAADGRPRAAAWPLGAENLETSPDEGGTCSFKAMGSRVLLLLSDPGVDRYRFEADVCHTRKIQQDIPGIVASFDEVGLALGYTVQDGPNGDRVHTWMVLRFSEFDPADGPAVRRHLEFVEYGLVEAPGLSIRNPSTQRGTPRAPLDRPGPPGPTWRRLSVDVTPDGVTVPGRAGRQLADAAGISRRRKGPMDPPAKSLEEQLAQTAGPVVLPGWSPRMPVGIWCRASAVTVRNVTIEKLK